MGEITKPEPSLELLSAMGIFGGDGAGIEESERQGGAEMVAAKHTLPTQGSDDPDVVALGIEWGSVIEADPIFREATLPTGWKRVAGDNPYGYWTYLIDEMGMKRAAIFYKAAFYDRDAFIRAER